MSFATSPSTKRHRSDDNLDGIDSKRQRTPLDQAIPFIILDPTTNKYKITDEAIRCLGNFHSPLGVVSIVGKYRGGKSFLMNNCLLELPPGMGFNVGSSVQSCTKGIMMWPKPIVCTDKYGNKFHALAIDSEGLGSMDATSTHDTTIFALVFLLSSMVIYNSIGVIDDASLNTLSVVVNVMKQIRIRANQTVSETLSSASSGEGQYFPSFLWLLRDFSLKLEDEKGQSITASQYMENSLAHRTNDGTDKNDIRAGIRALCPQRECMTLVRPCADERQLQNLAAFSRSNPAGWKAIFRPEFLNQCARLREHIVTTLPPKTASGRNISGSTLVQLASQYVNAINEGAVPVIQDSWSMLSDAQCRDAMDEVKHQWEARVQEADIGGKKWYVPVYLERQLREWHSSLLKEFKTKSAGFGSDGKYYTQLAEELQRSIRDLMQKNEARIVKRIQHIQNAFILPGVSKAKSTEDLKGLYDTGLEDFHKTIVSAGDDEMKSADPIWASQMIDMVWVWTSTFCNAQVQELNKAKAELEQHVAKNAELTSSIKQIEEEWKMQREERDKQIKALQTELLTLDGQQKEQIRSLAQELALMRQKCSEQLEENKSLVERNEELKTSAIKCLQLEMRKTELEEQLKQAQEKMDEIIKEKETQEKTHSDGVAQLAKQFQDLRSKRLKETEANKQLMAELDRLRKEYKEENEIQTMKNQQLERQLQDKDALVEQETKKRETEKKHLQQELAQAIKKRDEDRVALESELKKLNDVKQEETKVAQARERKMRDDWTTDKLADERKIHHAESQAAELRGRIDELNKQIEQIGPLRANESKLKQELDRMVLDKRMADFTNESLKKQTEDLSRQLKEAKDKAIALEKQIKESERRKLESLQAQLNLEQNYGF